MTYHGLSSLFCEIGLLIWYENTEDSLHDMSWHELFGCFLISTHTFPPVLTKHGEATLDDNEDAIVYTHTFTQGLKTWRRYVRAIEKVIPNLLPRKIPSAASMTRWKRKGPGVVGRIYQSVELRHIIHQWLASPTKRLSWPFWGDM